MSEIPAIGATNMGVYFLRDLWQPKASGWCCLYCEAVFGAKHALDDHYFAAHSEAFSEEEMEMVRIVRLRGPVKRSSLGPLA